MIPIFEAGDTVQFTWSASVAPDAAPVFSITEPFSKTVIQSVTAQQSGSKDYYSLYTMPQSLATYLFEWKAQKTLVGSVYDFFSRGTFRVEKTRF